VRIAEPIAHEVVDRAERFYRSVDCTLVQASYNGHTGQRPGSALEAHTSVGVSVETAQYPDLQLWAAAAFAAEQPSRSIRGCGSNQQPHPRAASQRRSHLLRLQGVP
jgi:hypothetical protein